MEIILNDQQAKALKGAKDFIKNFKPNEGKPFYYISGYAGTGKSTVIQFLLKEYKPTQYRVATFTGKAAKVVQERSGINCQTIHSLIYKPILNDKMEIIGWSLQPDNISKKVKLIVLDEVSMVGDKMWQDLLSFNKPIIVLGDSFQLPPVSGREIFTTDKIDILLTEIHRQALENPIIRLSKDLREYKDIPFGNYDNKVFKIPYESDIDISLYKKVEQILCGKNMTRKSMNNFYRKTILHYDSVLPLAGEKVMNLKNNHELGIMNGENILLKKDCYDYMSYYGRCRNITTLNINDTEADRIINLSTDNYDGVIRERFTKGGKFLCKNLLETDFSYCITTHKAQGSQYTSGIIIDESDIFGDAKYRWLYTALTRFIDKVIIMG